MYIDRPQIHYRHRFNREMKLYLDSPVASRTIIHSYSSVGQSVSKSAVMHVAERCNCLREEEQITNILIFKTNNPK